MKKVPLVLDIETVPLESALAAPYPEGERHAPSNYKDPEKIAAWHLRDEADWRASRVKTCSLNPRLGRVLCIGMTDEKGTDAVVHVAKTEADEPQLLRMFWTEVAKEGGEVVTWNGDFDLRFIVIRSLVHKINPTVRQETVRAWFQRYRTWPHFDCRAVLNNWNTYAEGEGLGEWSAFFGIEGKLPGVSAEDVYPLYLAGKFEQIEEYCARDVMATKKIYEQIAVMFDASSRVA